MLGLLLTCRWGRRRNTNGYPCQDTAQHPGLHRLETWQNRVSGFFDKEEVPAAKFDIDKDAQIAHARIAIATSHVVGKGPGNSIQRDFLSQAFLTLSSLL